MSTVVLVRPGSTDFDEQNRIQGSLDIPLNKRGEQQVQKIVDELRSVPLDLVYTSPCEPALGSATAIGAALGITVKELDGLRNLDQGLWQGLQVEDIRRKHPKVFKQWQESPETICPPQGEMVADALERIRKSLEKPLKKGVSFAVVAPEPLATLIGCFVRQSKVDLTASVCGPKPQSLCEYLKTNGRLPAGAKSDKNGTAAVAEVAPANPKEHRAS